jgi:hypothetical protein
MNCVEVKRMTLSTALTEDAVGDDLDGRHLFLCVAAVVKVKVVRVVEGSVLVMVVRLLAVGALGEVEEGLHFVAVFLFRGIVGIL